MFEKKQRESSILDALEEFELRMRGTIVTHVNSNEMQAKREDYLAKLHN